MSLLAQSFDTFTTVVAASGAEELKSSSEIRSGLISFIMPLIFLAIGLVAIKFLTQRQMTQFFQFAGIAMLVLLMLIKPEILQSVAQWFGEILT